MLGRNQIEGPIVSFMALAPRRVLEQLVRFFRDNVTRHGCRAGQADSKTTEETRKNAGAVAGYGVTEIADHIARQLGALGRGRSSSVIPSAG